MSRRPSARVLGSLLAASFLLAPRVQAESWPPIEPDQLKLAAPRVDPNADAEALSWEVRAEDAIDGIHLTTTLWHHLRIKVFNERGREQSSRVDIPFARGRKVDEISARTVLADGREIRLRGQDVFERTWFKAGRQRVRAKSFVFPGVEVGAILDCRWRELRLDDQGLTAGFEFQRDIPVHRVTYHLKPLLLPGGPAMRFTIYNAAIPPLEREPDGYYTTTLKNVPAFREEPFMPPELEVRPWLLVYYTTHTTADVDRFWQDVGKAVYSSTRDVFQKNREIREAAIRIVGDASADDDKLRRLYEFCRHDIRNLDDDATAGSTEERRRPKNARETLEQKQGGAFNIDALFGSLAASLGYDVRMAQLANRERGSFSRSSLNPFMLSTYNVAVRVGDGWRFFDPAVPSLPFGMLRWQEEGQEALIPDPKDPAWVVTPASAAEGSCIRRIGTFMLQADGTLMGAARCEYTGHAGGQQKELYDDMSPEERENELRETIRDGMPTAEVSGVVFENTDGPELPLTVRFSLTIPGYAQATGKRLFFQPGAFEHGEKPTFSATIREHPIDFHYRWSEQDSLVIQLPEGYELDNPEAPSNHRIGDFGEYQVRLGIANEGRVLVYRRAFRFDRVRFTRDEYPALKSDFQTIHERDHHTLAVHKTGG